MKNSTFSLLLGESFFDIDFEVIFRFFFFFLERPTLNPLAMAQSKRMSALFRILGKKNINLLKINQKIALKSYKFYKKGCLEMFLFS
jgi:hypothetical protein